jgi:hypothetical protein
MVSAMKECSIPRTTHTPPAPGLMPRFHCLLVQSLLLSLPVPAEAAMLCYCDFGTAFSCFTGENVSESQQLSIASRERRIGGRRRAP